ETENRKETTRSAKGTLPLRSLRLLWFLPSFSNMVSLHFEIAYGHALIELVVLDVKLDVIFAGFWNCQLSHVNPVDFADAARSYNRRGRSLGTKRQWCLGLGGRKAVGLIRQMNAHSAGFSTAQRFVLEIIFNTAGKFGAG